MNKTKLLDRAERVIRSCETPTQLEVAQRYANLVVKRAFKGNRENWFLRREYFAKFSNMVHDRKEFVTDQRYGRLLTDMEGNP